MDRMTVFPGQVPLETDLLNTNRNVLIALGKISGALFGVGGIVRGLAVGPSIPAALSVSVGPGEIYQQAVVDATAYSSLSADTTDTIVKQGLLLAKNAPVTLSCPAPVASGQSINYLIEAAYADADINPLTLPYYDASNPTVAWSGPNNSGATNNATRAGLVNLVVKPGASAATGSQTTPTADAGFIPLAVVTVAYGQTSITASNITAVNAGRTSNDLLHTVQQNSANYALDTGAANASVVSITPAPATLTDGLPVFFRVAASNTGASTLNLNSLGAYPIVGPTGGAIVSGELTAGQIASVVWNAPLTAWQLQGFAAGSSSGSVTAGTYGSSTSVAVIGISSSGVVTSANSTAIAFPVTSVFGRTGAITLQSSDISTALGYAPLGGNIAASSLLGNPTGSAAAPSVITLANGLQFSGAALGLGAIAVTGLTDTGNAQIQGAMSVGSSNVPAGALDVGTSVGRVLIRTASVNSSTVNTFDSVNANNSAYAPLNVTATALTIAAPVTVAGTLGVSSNTSLGGNLSVTGNSVLSGSLTTAGAMYANGALTVGTSSSPTSLQVYGSASITGEAQFTAAYASNLAATGNNVSGIVVSAGTSGSTAGPSYINIIRQGSFGANIGIDTDNQWKVGGGSMGSSAYRIVHEGLSAVNLSGSLTSANFISGQEIFSSQGFISTGQNVNLASSGSGGSAYIQPNGLNIGTGQTIFASNGNVAFSGSITAANLGTMASQSASSYLAITGGTLQGPLATATSTNSLVIAANGSSGQVMNTANGNLGGLMILSPNNNAAACYMAFQRVGSYGAYFGIDSDNQWKVGGWSMGANVYRMVHEGLSSVSLAGTLTTAGALQVNSTISSTGTVSFNTSDETLKDIYDHNAEPQPLHKVAPFTAYRRIDTGEHGRGPTAQAMQRAQPLYVREYAHPMPNGGTEPKLGIGTAAAALEQAWWCGVQIDRLFERVTTLESRL